MELPVRWVDVLKSLRSSASDVDAEWMKRHRKTDTIKLMTCILSSLQHRASIKSILHTIDSCDFTFTAYNNAMKRCPVSVFKHLHYKLIGGTRRGRTLAADGSRIALTKSQSGTRAGRTGSIPTCLLSSIYDVNNKVIVSMDLSDHYDERAALKRMLVDVKAGDTLVMDRGYYSDSLLQLLDAQGIKFVCRLRSNIGGKFTPLGNGIFRTPSGTTVVISSYTAGGTCFKVLHSLRIPANKAKRLYKQRWDIEETFKSLKCTIGLRASQLKTNAKTELGKYMWVCASLHYLQRLIVFNSNRQPYNGVQVVKWLIYKLCGGQSNRIEFNKMYSTKGNKRCRNKTTQPS